MVLIRRVWRRSSAAGASLTRLRVGLEHPRIAAEGASASRDEPAQPVRTHRRRRYTRRRMNVVVLPTYNERENLRHALARIREVADGHGCRSTR